jgi:lysozyme family protein
MTDIPALIKQNEQRWNGMVIIPSLLPQVDAVAHRLVTPIAQARYEDVEKTTGVPANVIAVIHERESSQNWKCSLAQGDPWNQVSTHVPRGRGPFKSWEDAAVDALENCAPYASRWKDWSPGGTLTLLETYNGLGYANRHAPSPYIWASTNQYTKGKYVADGVYDPEAVDHQIGCAALLKRMKELQGVRPVPTPTPVPVPVPSVPWWRVIIDFMLPIFRRRQ